RCLETVWTTTASARSDGCELEILVVDNGSLEPETNVLFQHWRNRIQVLRSDEPFNWSRLNNQAAAIAKGELLLFLNNDIEAVESGWFEAMAAQAMRPKVGAVGALLLYPDGTIQHGGYVVGLDHAFRNLRPNHAVHRGRSRLLSSWGAVTGACLMLRKQLLERLGGLDEGLPVEFNDVDLCLRLVQLGYHCVIPPETVLIHHECQSRNSKTSKTALTCLNRLENRWHGYFGHNDAYWPAQSEKNLEDGRPVGLQEVSLRKHRCF
ncbi:glycosyltransferase family 2 protein, partial [bacterium]|nr:glycosyltransferase family 2 protein [bacterium]